MEICISDLTEVKENSSGPHQLLSDTAGRTSAQGGKHKTVISHGEAGGRVAGQREPQVTSLGVRPPGKGGTARGMRRGQGGRPQAPAARCTRPPASSRVLRPQAVGPLYLLKHSRLHQPILLSLTMFGGPPWSTGCEGWFDMGV